MRRYDGTGNGPDLALSVALSPDGSRVYVSGYSLGTGGEDGFDYATVAYDPATGAELWVRRYNGPRAVIPPSEDHASSVAASSTRVFVTGFSDGDFATVAYDAITGAQLWASRSHTYGYGQAFSVDVSPDGARVYVTGYQGDDRTTDYVTEAYDAVTGAGLWTRRYNGPGNGYDQARSLAISLDGAAVYVTGFSVGAGTGGDYATVAYDAVTGAKLWVRRYNGPVNGDDEAFSLAVSADGVFVTGYSDSGPGEGYDYATVAYDAATGATRWARRYKGDFALSVAVSPTGARVYVTGLSGTLAYDSVSGAKLWFGPSWPARAVTVSPDGARVYITGESGSDYATAAYRG